MNQAEKSERTREAICIAARQLFADKGYDMTTMQDIVTTSGMSKGGDLSSFLVETGGTAFRCCGGVALSERIC